MKSSLWDGCQAVLECTHFKWKSSCGSSLEEPGTLQWSMKYPSINFKLTCLTFSWNKKLEESRLSTGWCCARRWGGWLQSLCNVVSDFPDTFCIRKQFTQKVLKRNTCVHKNIRLICVRYWGEPLLQVHQGILKPCIYSGEAVRKVSVFRRCF